MRAFALMMVLVLGVLPLLYGPSSVFGHAGYDSSIPGVDEVVEVAPARVDIFFTQEVLKQQGLNFVRVLDDAGAPVSDGDGIVDDDDRAHIYAELPADIAPGRYLVEWMTTSFDDGETDDGAFCFYFAVQPTAEQQAACALLAGEDGEETPTSGAQVTATAPATAPTEAAVATSTSEQPAPTPTAIEEDDDDGAPVGAIIGVITVGVVVVGIIVAGVAVWLRRTPQE